MNTLHFYMFVNIQLQDSLLRLGVYYSALVCCNDGAVNCVCCVDNLCDFKDFSETESCCFCWVIY